jgi:hypothetical protein
MRRMARGLKVMSALHPDGLVAHEWEEDRRLCHGLVLGVVNATNHLCLVGLGPGERSTRVVSLWFVWPLSSSTTPNLGLGDVGYLGSKV